MPINTTINYYILQGKQYAGCNPADYSVQGPLLDLGIKSWLVVDF